MRLGLVSPCVSCLVVTGGLVIMVSLVCERVIAAVTVRFLLIYSPAPCVIMKSTLVASDIIPLEYPC